MSNFDYDTIVIGSGVGGLTAGLSLAQAGQKVVIFEQHYLPGGWSHSFPFQHHMFCPGIHYIGELGPNERIRQFLEDLGIANDIAFTELNPDAYDRAICPEMRFNFPKGKEAFSHRLTQLFPRESKGIERYISTCERLSKEWEDSDYFTNGIKDVFSLPFRAPTTARFALCTFTDFLNHFVSDPRLHWILATQCLDSGSSPGRVSGPAQAIVNWHYVNGGYYPKGGMKRVVGAYVKAFRRAGGTIHMRTRVRKILTSNTNGRRAIGVRLDDDTEIRAKNIISNADVGTTFQHLIDRRHLSRFLAWRLKRTRYSSSCASIYMVLDAEPRELGLDSGNVFYSQSIDLEKDYKLALSIDILKADHFPIFFLSSDSAKDPDRFSEKKGYTANAFAPMNHDTFKQFEGSSHGERSEGYDGMKARLAEMMLGSVSQVVPRIGEHLIAYDIGTPLTNTYYISGTQGSMYGTEKITEFAGPFAHNVKTEFKDLYMCGHSTAGHGFIGAIISGRIAAAKAIGCSIRELPRAKDQHLNTILEKR